MQKMLYILSGSYPIYGLILIVGSLCPLFLLLMSISILLKTKTAFTSNASKAVEFQQRLGAACIVVVLLICLIIGICLLQSAQSTLLMALRLGILPGVILGILLGIWAQTMTVQIGLYGFIYSLLMGPILIGQFIKARLAKEKFYGIAWQALFVPRIVPCIFLLLYGGYTFWISQQMNSNQIGFWCTFMTAIVTALMATNISPLLETIKQARKNSPQKLSLAYVIGLADFYRYTCTTVMGLVLPLLVLALIGGCISAFLYYMFLQV